MELDGSPRRYAKTQAGLETAGDLGIPFARGKIAAGARIAWRPPRSELRSTRYLQLERRAIARIDEARTRKPRKVFCIDGIAL